MSKAKEYPLVRVSWLDAHSGANYLTEYSADDIPHGPAHAYTVGYMIRNDEKGITVMGEFFPDDAQFRGRTFIPAGMVLGVDKLRIASKPKPRANAAPSASVEPISTQD